MSGEIACERRDDIAVLTLHNEKKKNALDPVMLDGLVARLGELPSEGARAVVLTGSGDWFSSGYDIAALPQGAPAASPMAASIAAIVDGPLPVIAALNGPAIGGGCELAATCDLRVAHAEVTLMMPPVRLGIVYAPEGLRRFVALCGMSRTRELFLTAAPMSAERALGWGLVDRVVAREDVVATAVAIANEMARGAPLAIAGTRRVLELMSPAADGAAAAEIARIVAAAWASADAAEARAAFRDKRKPRFSGR